MARVSGRLLTGLVSTLVGIAVVVGLFVVGSPGEARLRRFDDRRLDDLRQMAAAVDAYEQRHQQLPPSLHDLVTEAAPTFEAKDPATGEAYGYRPIDSIAYELCATFARSSDAAERWRADPWWGHRSGRHCFRRQARERR
jgi:hypothetical protein